MCGVICTDLIITALQSMHQFPTLWSHWSIIFWKVLCPEVYQLFLKFFIILTNIDTLLCKSGEKTLEQREQTAQACEELGKFFPVNFKRPLTRKLHILSYVAPQQIRNVVMFYCSSMSYYQ